VLFGSSYSCDNVDKLESSRRGDSTYHLGDLRVEAREGLGDSKSIRVSDVADELSLSGAVNGEVSELCAHYKNLEVGIGIVSSDAVIDIDAMPHRLGYVLSAAQDFAKKMLSHKRWPAEVAPYKNLVTKIAHGRFKAYVDILPSLFCSSSRVFFADTEGLTARTSLIMPTDYLMEELYVARNEYKLVHNTFLAVTVTNGKAHIRHLDEISEGQREMDLDDLTWQVRYLATTEAGKLLPADVRAVYEVIWQALNDPDAETGADVDSQALWSLTDPWISRMLSDGDIDISAFEEDFEPFSVNGAGVHIDDEPYNRAIVFSTDSGILSVKPKGRRASASFKLYEEQPGPPLVSLDLAYRADFPSLNVHLPEDVDELLSEVDDIVASIEASSADAWPNLELRELVMHLLNAITERRIVVNDRQRGESFISDTELEGKNVEVTLSMFSPPDDRIEIRTGSEGFKIYIENRDLMVCISKGSEIAQSTTKGSLYEMDSEAISDLKYMAQMLETYRSELDGTIDGGIEDLNRFLENPRIPTIELVDELPPPEWSWAAKMAKMKEYSAQ
jgi:hypothetical protein